MLAALDLRLHIDEDGRLPNPCAHLLHAALLNLVREFDPAASEDLHKDAQVKPFSISTIITDTDMEGDYVQLKAGCECRIRVCCAGRDTFKSLGMPLLSGVDNDRRISLNGISFRIARVSLASPFGGSAEFEQLLRPAGKTARFMFNSPTTFRRRGLNVPLPDPHLVYGSLWQKWCALSTIPVGEEIYEQLISSVALSHSSVRTKVWKFPGFVLTGFTGKAVFEIVKPVPQDVESLFGALSGLAFYTGVGYRTTMGMGQCTVNM